MLLEQEETFAFRVITLQAPEKLLLESSTSHVIEVGKLFSDLA